MTYSNDTKFQDNIWTTETSGPSGPTIEKPDTTLFTDGFSYGVSGTPPKAPNQNWLQNRSDSFCALIEKYGSISYLTGVDYNVGATVYNDNNGTVSVYKCNIPNGPSTAAVNPVGDASGTWTRINQWSSEGYNPNTVIVSDADGNIFANNIPFLPWLNTTSYPTGSLVTGSDGNFYFANSISTNLDPVNDTTDAWRQYPAKTTTTSAFHVVEYFDGRVEISMRGLNSDSTGRSLFNLPLGIVLADTNYKPMITDTSQVVNNIFQVAFDGSGTATTTSFNIFLANQDGTPAENDTANIYLSYVKA